MPRRKSAALSEIETRIDANDTLSSAEKEEVRARAREHVAKARKEKDTDRLFDAMVKEVEREYDPKEQLEDFTVDLPEYTPFLKVDNVIYFHGLTYEVPYSFARSFADNQARAWEHEREWKEGKHRTADASRRPRHLHINQHGAVSNTQNMRIPRM